MWAMHSVNRLGRTWAETIYGPVYVIARSTMRHPDFEGLTWLVWGERRGVAGVFRAHQDSFLGMPAVFHKS
jgi:hypothetical protein